MKRLAQIALATAVFSVCGFLSGDAGALTPSQCTYFAINGKTTICHATGSARGPYTFLEISVKACMSGHAGHPSDFVAVDDSSCNGSGSLPEGAPCDDATVACSANLICTSGYCRADSVQ